MYIRHDVLHAMLHWQQECMDHPTLWDQNLFKDVLKVGGLRFRSSQVLTEKRLFLGYNGTIAIGILPVSTFCSGCAQQPRGREAHAAHEGASSHTPPVKKSTRLPTLRSSSEPESGHE